MRVGETLLYLSMADTAVVGPAEFCKWLNGKVFASLVGFDSCCSRYAMGALDRWTTNPIEQCSCYRDQEGNLQGCLRRSAIDRHPQRGCHPRTSGRP